METTSLKALAEKVLQGNQWGNITETSSFHTGKPEGAKVSVTNTDDMATFLSVLTEDERFLFEERAAIMEYDGGLTREEAERQARQILRVGKDVNHRYHMG